MTLARRLALVVLALAPVSVALAQPKPALVQDRDEPGRSPFVEAVQVIADPHCTASLCSYDFAAVPTGKRLVVTHVAVEVDNQDTASPTAAAYLVRNGGDMLPLGVIQRAASRFVLSMPVTYYVEAGQTPRIVLVADLIEQTGTLRAALVGYFVSLP